MVNESELYSQECATEKWTGNTENTRLDAPIAERICDIAAKRNEFYKKSLSLKEKCHIDAPTFSKWTLYDPAQHRIYASFDNAKEVVDFIRDEAFPAFWVKMILDRKLALSEVKIHHATANCYFACGNVALCPNDIKLYDEAEAIYVPTEWDVKFIPVTKDVVADIKRTFGELNESWKAEELPF